MFIYAVPEKNPRQQKYLLTLSLLLKNRGAAAPLNYKHTNYLVLTIFTLLYPDL